MGVGDGSRCFRRCRRKRPQGQPPHASPQLCHPHGGTRSRPSQRSEAARSRGHCDHTGLHPRCNGAPQARPSRASSTREKKTGNSGQSSGWSDFGGEGMKTGATESETLAEQFLAMLQNERNASVHTVRAYRREVSNFVAYLRETLGPQAPIAAVEHLHIRAYLGLLFERNLTKASAARALDR